MATFAAFAAVFLFFELFRALHLDRFFVAGIDSRLRAQLGEQVLVDTTYQYSMISWSLSTSLNAFALLAPHFDSLFSQGVSEIAVIGLIALVLLPVVWAAQAKSSEFVRPPYVVRKLLLNHGGWSHSFGDGLGSLAEWLSPRKALLVLVPFGLQLWLLRAGFSE